MSLDLSAVRAAITPTAEEARAMAAFVQALESDGNEALAAEGVAGRATVQGSLAKGTWLQGSTDADLFLLLDPDVPASTLDDVAHRVGTRILGPVQRKYAQHPYVIGARDGIEVDVVPAYAVPEASARMSAVDRTPFHTAWVREHLDETGRADVRLLKQWLKGIGDYGAETAVGGISGYLAEVLVAAHGTFDDALSYLEHPTRLALGEDHVDDPVSPWVVVDPIDPARNCAAAVTRDTLDHIAKAARAFLEEPDRRFFFPAPPRAEPAPVLQDALDRQDAVWSGILLRGHAIDQVIPQFQKAARAWCQEVDREIPVHRMHVEHRGDDLLVHLVGSARTLPPTRTHTGPPTQSKHADRFRAKWSDHPDAAGPVEEHGGLLVVEVHEQARGLADRLRLAVERVQVGKHVRRALQQHRILEDPSDAGAWGPEVAELVLAREPWER